MASKVKKDPLSRYFKDLDDFDVSSGEDSEEDGETTGSTINANSVPTQLSKANTHSDRSSAKSEKQSDNTEKPAGKKLPSAHDCLKNQSSPAFLRLNQQKEVDWDKNALSLDQPDDGPVDFEKNAVPPPTSYEPVTDSETKVVDSEGNKRKRNDDEQDQVTPTKAYKVHKDEEDDNS